MIIIDSREQIRLFQDPKYETIIRKLDEGDYNQPGLEQHIVCERKTCNDFYSTIIQGHARFKKEILRSIEKNKKFYIFVEGSREHFLSLKWSKQYLRCRGRVLAKIIDTMTERYKLIIVWCEGPRDMEQKILECFRENNRNVETISMQ